MFRDDSYKITINLCEYTIDRAVIRQMCRDATDDKARIIIGSHRCCSSVSPTKPKAKKVIEA